MKVLLLNGSMHRNGTTYAALAEAARTLEAEGLETEIFQIGPGLIRDCIDCRKCTAEGCIFTDDPVNDFVARAKEADGFIFGTPVYYAHPSGRVLSFLDRAFYSSKKAFAYKPGAAIAVARRGGTSASLDAMNKYFGITSMPTVGSSYWNMVHGMDGEEAKLDIEGMQTVRNLAHNMAWLIRCIEAGKANGVPQPVMERGSRLNFIH
ncbi:MAG: flavodoxin family protein [Lachnospiraceae bacterium]|nr:flavodoxin family protein [Lachnospiraceae bacterium]